MRKIQTSVLVLLLLAGCAGGRKATYIENIHEGLSYSQASYKRILEGFAQAQLDGRVSDEQMENVIRVGRSWQSTHNLVITLSQTYVSMPPGDAKDAAQIRLTALSQSLDSIMLELIEMLALYGVGT